MNNKLHVGRLPYAMSSEELAETFKEFGEIVSANIIKDRETGRSKGFGFVEFATDEQASAAVSAMDGAEIDGRNITVSVARPMEPRAPRSNNGPRRDFRPRFSR